MLNLANNESDEDATTADQSKTLEPRRGHTRYVTEATRVAQLKRMSPPLKSRLTDDAESLAALVAHQATDHGEEQIETLSNTARVTVEAVGFKNVKQKH